jgi:hypothetical protein
VKFEPRNGAAFKHRAEANQAVTASVLPPTTTPRSVPIPKHPQAIMQHGQSGLMMRALGREP